MDFNLVVGQIKERCSAPDSELMFFSTLTKTCSFKKGEHLVKEGDVVENIYFLLKGIVRLYYLTPEGKEVISAFDREGDFTASYRSIILKRESHLYVQAIEDIEAVYISYDDVQNLYSRHSCWQELGRKSAEFEFLEKEDREYNFLTKDSVNRYLDFKERYGDLEVRISDQHIASYLGVTPETLSRLKVKVKALL